MTAETVLRMHGEIDYGTVDEWKSAITMALLDPPDLLALDLADVTFMDSMGVAMLLAARARCLEDSVAFELRSTSVAVREVIRVAGLDVIFATDGLSS